MLPSVLAARNALSDIVVTARGQRGDNIGLVRLGGGEDGSRGARRSTQRVRSGHLRRI